MLTPESFTRTLADLTRLRILMLLLQEEELCVCHLTKILEMVQPKVSRHLAVLREKVFFRIAVPVCGFIIVCIPKYPPGVIKRYCHYLRVVLTPNLTLMTERDSINWTYHPEGQILANLKKLAKAASR